MFFSATEVPNSLASAELLALYGGETCFGQFCKSTGRVWSKFIWEGGANYSILLSTWKGVEIMQAVGPDLGSPKNFRSSL